MASRRSSMTCDWTAQHRDDLEPRSKEEYRYVWENIVLQVIQFVTFLSPIVGGHSTFELPGLGAGPHLFLRSFSVKTACQNTELQGTHQCRTFRKIVTICWEGTCKWTILILCVWTCLEMLVDAAVEGLSNSIPTVIPLTQAKGPQGNY